MIRTKFIEEKLRHGRFDAKTLDSMFRRRIEEGANRSPFVSQAILDTVKEVFSLAPEDADHQLGLGQIPLPVVAAEEPAGKPLEQCQKMSGAGDHGHRVGSFAGSMPPRVTPRCRSDG
jgi:hypothetical protein